MAITIVQCRDTKFTKIKDENGDFIETGDSPVLIELSPNSCFSVIENLTVLEPIELINQ